MPNRRVFYPNFAHQQINVPLQACLLMSEEASVQSVHNLIILEEELKPTSIRDAHR